MDTTKLSRFASIGGATDGHFYAVELTNRTGQTFDAALDQADLEKALNLLMGLASDAARVAPEAVKLNSAAGPFPVSNLTLTRGRAPEEVILGIQSGKVVMSYTLHITTLMKLCGALQAAPR